MAVGNPLGATILEDKPPSNKKSSSNNDDDLDIPKVGRNTRKPDLTQPLMQVYVTVGMALAGFPATRNDAQVVFANAENAAKSVAKLADDDPKVRKVIEKFLSASAYAGVVAAHMPIVIGIMANHGVNMPFLPSNEERENDAA